MVVYLVDLAAFMEIGTEWGYSEFKCQSPLFRAKKARF